MLTQVVYLLQLLDFASARVCYNATVPVTIKSRNAVFDLVQPQTGLDVTEFIQNLTRLGNNATGSALTGYADVSGTYNMSTKFCMPDAMANGSMTSPFVQVLTHGIGFDKTYWDLAYNNYNYSYVNNALAAGYCTLSYDRLGVGNSSKGEPINEIQSFLEIQALRALTTMLRNGTFPNVTHAFGSSIVHVGHSFGSAQTYAFANLYPNETSGIVLTGFSMNASNVGLFGAGGNFMIASQDQPLRFGNVSAMYLQNLVNNSPFADYITGLDLTNIPKGQNLPNGYLVHNNVEANQYLFYFPGYFDKGLLYLSEQTKQAVTYGELLTLASLTPTNNFAGPVLVITGSNDLPYCGGNCFATGGALQSIPAGVANNFPNVPAGNFTAYIQPNTGHGINTHYNSTAAYTYIQNFLRTKNLQPM